MSSGHDGNEGRPCLAGLVVHWHTEKALSRLLEAWPHDDPRFELCVVDNGSTTDQWPTCPDTVRLIRPEHNLGFAGGMNAALEATTAPWVLLLNADVRPRFESLDELLAGFGEYPDVAGLAPRLVGDDGQSQTEWQLRRLPALVDLVAMTLFLDGVLRRRLGTGLEPAAGSPVQQPAAAALALRRSALEELGGLDELFYPAWFEDVDLAKRLATGDRVVRYWPRSVLVHELGSTVDVLGYGRFLVTYDRNLLRYTRKHHGAVGELVVRSGLLIGALIRLATLWLRKPARARTRAEAARGLLSVARGACIGFSAPDPGTRPLRGRSTSHD